MAKISDNAIITALRLEQQSSDPAAPAATGWKLYFKSGGLYARNSAGTVVGPFVTTGGAVALDDLTDVTLGSPSTGHVLTYDTDHWESAAPQAGGSETSIITLGIAGSLAVGGGALRIYLPWACTITNIRATVGTAPTGADLIVDIHYDGTTLFATQGNRPTIAASAYSDLTNAPDTTALTKDHYLQIYVDQVGSTVPGADVQVQIEVTVP